MTPWRRPSNETKEKQNAALKLHSKSVPAVVERRLTRSSIEAPENRNAFSRIPKTRPITKKTVVKKEPVEADHREVRGIDTAAYFAEDVYEYLLAKEATLKRQRVVVKKNAVTPRLRRVLIDWLMQVHGRFGLVPETLCLTVHLVDSAFTQLKVEKMDLQLVGVACLLIAAKFEEMDAPTLYDFECVADNAFTRRQLVKMEQTVIQNCDPPLSKPYSITFLRWLSKEMGASARQIAMATYLGEVALIDHRMSPYLPSQTAAICVYMARHLAGAEIDVKKIVEMIEWSEEEMKAGARFLAQATLRLHNHKRLLAVQQKFSTSKFSSVSKLKNEEIAALESLEK